MTTSHTRVCFKCWRHEQTHDRLDYFPLLVENRYWRYLCQSCWWAHPDSEWWYDRDGKRPRRPEATEKPPENWGLP